MKTQKRADIIARLAEITRELERLTTSPAINPSPEEVDKLRAKQDELKCALESDGRDSLG